MRFNIKNTGKLLAKQFHDEPETMMQLFGIVALEISKIQKAERIKSKNRISAMIRRGKKLKDISFETEKAMYKRTKKTLDSLKTVSKS